MLQKVGNQPGDEHRLARPRQTGDPQPQHLIGTEQRARDTFNAAQHPVCHIENAQTLSLHLRPAKIGTQVPQV